MDRYMYEYTYLHRDFEAVCALIENEPQRVLESATELAARHGDDIVTELHVGMGGFEVGRDVNVEVTGFEREPGQVARLTFRWVPTAARGLFPTMEADLEVYPLSTGSRPLCQLAFIGHYRPPLWLLGSALDGLAGRRVAAAVVHHFLEEVKARLERELSSRGVGRYLVTPPRQESVA